MCVLWIYNVSSCATVCVCLFAFDVVFPILLSNLIGDAYVAVCTQVALTSRRTEFRACKYAKRNGIWRRWVERQTRAHTFSLFFINIWDALPAKCFCPLRTANEKINSIQLLWNPELLTLSRQTLAIRSRVLPPFDKSADLWWLGADCDWKSSVMPHNGSILANRKQTTCSSSRYS